MPIAFPVGSSSIPLAPATAPRPINSVQKISRRLAVLYLDFIFNHSAFLAENILKIMYIRSSAVIEAQSTAYIAPTLTLFSKK